VRRRFRGKSSRVLVWLGGAGAFLLGGLVTAAQGVPAQAYHDRAAALHDVHERTGSGHAGIDAGLAREIADYLKSGNAAAASSPALQHFAQAASPPAPQQAPAAQQLSYVGQETCTACHMQENANWAHTVHAKVFELNPRNQLEMQGCEACHGPGSVHVQNPAEPQSIIRFSRRSVLPISEQNGVCLTCHRGGQRIFWNSSVHETAEVACSDCHNPMANFSLRGLQARTSVNETCFQCHKTQRAEFSRRSHMPLLEGRMTCSDCHNPHGSTTEPLLKADSVNEVCFTCHAEKRGPFLFEHAPVRESCVNCHQPHGSNHEKLLVTTRPLLCQQCHSQLGHPTQLMTRGHMATGSVPDVRLLSRSCSNCHSQIHGSNHPSGAKFER
jgi:DmsE family decaheme c-type cytochrome